MDTTEIIQTIDAEIARLEKARVLLNADSHLCSKARAVPHLQTHLHPQGSETPEDQRGGTGEDCSGAKGEMGKSQERLNNGAR